jgi:hypothetical protein
VKVFFGQLPGLIEETAENLIIVSAPPVTTLQTVNVTVMNHYGAAQVPSQNSLKFAYVAGV